MRRVRRADRLHLSRWADQEVRAQLAFVVAALHQHRRAGGQRARAVAAGVDHRPSAAVLHHHMGAEDFRDAALHGDDAAARRQFGDRGGDGRRHLDRRAGERHRAGAAGRACRKKGGGSDAEPFAASDVQSWHVMVSGWCLDDIRLDPSRRPPLNRPVQLRFSGGA